MGDLNARAQGPVYKAKAELTRACARARLFLSSYAVLFGILAIRFHGLALELICGGLAVIGVLDTFWITHRAKTGVMTHEIVVTSSADTGGEVGGYLASYLLPFVTVSTPGWRDLLGYSLFLVVALVIYVRSNLVRVNPTLYVLGYRVLAVTYGDQSSQYLVTRIAPRDGSTIDVVDVAGVLLVAGGSHANS